MKKSIRELLMQREAVHLPRLSEARETVLRQEFPQNRGRVSSGPVCWLQLILGLKWRQQCALLSVVWLGALGFRLATASTGDAPPVESGTVQHWNKRRHMLGEVLHSLEIKNSTPADRPKPFRGDYPAIHLFNV